jgi:hypothetical protein
LIHQEEILIKLTKAQLKAGVVVEFKFENNLFTPYRLSTDKNRPNSLTTIQNTMINIEEAITIQNLIDQENPLLNLDKLSI